MTPQPLTKETLAALLNGRQYSNEITHLEEVAAKDAGLVVVFLELDDYAKFRGAISDNVYCHSGDEFIVKKCGVVPLPDRYELKVLERFGVRQHVLMGKRIEVVWSPNIRSWIYRTEIPHATFEILDAGNPYCRGIVFSVADLEVST